MNLNEKEILLIKALKSLPYDGNDSDKETAVIITILFANQKKCIDEILRLTDEAESLDDLIAEIFKNEEVEIEE